MRRPAGILPLLEKRLSAGALPVQGEFELKSRSAKKEEGAERTRRPAPLRRRVYLDGDGIALGDELPCKGCVDTTG